MHFPKSGLSIVSCFFLSFFFLSTSRGCPDFPDPGFRWKETFQVRARSSTHVFDLEEQHKQLYQKTFNVKELLEQVLSNDGLYREFLLHFVSLLCRDLEAYRRFSPYFWNLNDDNNDIKSVISKSNFSPANAREINNSNGVLDSDDVEDLLAILQIIQKYFRKGTTAETLFQDITSEPQKLEEFILCPRDCLTAIFQVERVQKIICENIKRILGRNFCMASFSCLYDDHVHHVDLTHNKDAVFVSGTGNDLLKILETFAPFAKYEFVIFTKREQKSTELTLSFLRRNLKNLFSYDSDMVPPNIVDKKQAFLTEVEQYEEKLKEFDRLYGQEVENTVKLDEKPKTLAAASSHTVCKLEDAVQEYRTNLDSYQANLAEAVRRSHNILEALKRIGEHVRNPEIHKHFCHSEQVMLLFLYNTLTRQYIEDLHLNDELRGIVFNVYSTHDTCERCTLTFFYELLQTHVNSKTKRQDQDPHLGKKSISVFEKFNNIFCGIKNKDRGDGPMLDHSVPFAILISSTDLEAVGGSARRAFTAHDGYENEPLCVDYFSPLVAFCLYPQLSRQDYQCTPLTPFLRLNHEKALREAISCSRERAVEELLRVPMDPFKTDHNHWTSLHILAQRHEKDLQRLIIHHLQERYGNARWHDAFLAKNNDNDTSLHVAVNHDNIAFLNSILDEGFPWWIFSYVRGNNGNTLMHTAAAQGSRTMVRFLGSLYPRYQSGVSFDYSVRTDDGLTVRDIAERSGSLESVMDLLPD